MLFEELQMEITSSSDVGFLNSHRTSTPVWLIRLVCTAHAGTASLAECRDLCEWFGVERRRATIHHWYQEYAEHHNQEFTVEPDRIAVDEKQIQFENEEKAWLYAAIDVDTKLVLDVQISQHRGRDPAGQFLAELETWNGSQASAKCWLTAYTVYYNHHRSHQALDNQPPIEALKQEGSI